MQQMQLISSISALAASISLLFTCLKVESSKGLTSTDIQQLTALLREKTRVLVGQEMVHEVVAAVTAFLEARNEKPESLLEQGINRRTREEEALRSLRMDAASMPSRAHPSVNR